MREMWARRIVALTTLLVIGLAAAFAVLQNPTVPRTAPASMEGAARVTAGRTIYDAQGCARCHAIAGQGGSRHALDGVADRRTPEELLDWVIGNPAVKDRMASSIYGAKQDYQKLSEEDREALTTYLSTLRRADASPAPRGDQGPR
jgi:mono/diheme cytochrome c family protein